MGAQHGPFFGEVRGLELSASLNKTLPHSVTHRAMLVGAQHGPFFGEVRGLEMSASLNRTFTSFHYPQRYASGSSARSILW